MEEKKTVLIAEDDESLGNILREKMLAAGLEALVVNNGEKCVSYVREHKPDLLVLDILMPIMTGIETLKEIKGDKELENLPVIVLTNFTDVKKISEVLELGVTDYYIKSDNPIDRIIEKIYEKLELMDKNKKEEKTS